jgi:formamidopyrimidine-DNA glycosylase
MPELPEVETIARNLALHLPQRRIVGIANLDWPRMIETPDVPLFEGIIVGRTICAVGRRAKWLLLSLDSEWTLAIHLRMSGRLTVVGGDVPIDKHTHLALALDTNHVLHFRDPRKFGRVRLLDAEGLATLDAAYGIEPLSDAFTVDCLATHLARHTTRMKPLLLDQKMVAGLGNIYVDEALWQARLHPLRPAKSLAYEEVVRLREAIRNVLQQALMFGGSTLRDYRDGDGQPGRNQDHVVVYRRHGTPCPACGTMIERIVVVQRGTHICPTCQPSP